MSKWRAKAENSAMFQTMLEPIQTKQETVSNCNFVLSERRHLPSPAIHDKMFDGISRLDEDLAIGKNVRSVNYNGLVI